MAKFLLIIILLVNCYTPQEFDELPKINFDSKTCLDDSKISVNLLLGNPSCANLDKNNFLLIKRQYILSYNDTTKYANWVSWHLSEDWLGETKRQNDFREDDTLPESFYKVKKSDYKDSGFDRGHICPSGDRTLNEEDNSATFLMTNILPQSPRNNRVTWKNLEEYERKKTREGFELYIYAGGYGLGGTGKKGFQTKISEKVLVPERVWKILVQIPNGDNDLERINENTEIISVDMPNSEEIDSNWKNYLTSINSIEKKTGFNFLTSIPEKISSMLKNKKQIYKKKNEEGFD